MRRAPLLFLAKILHFRIRALPEHKYGFSRSRGCRADQLRRARTDIPPVMAQKQSAPVRLRYAGKRAAKARAEQNIRPAAKQKKLRAGKTVVKAAGAVKQSLPLRIFSAARQLLFVARYACGICGKLCAAAQNRPRGYAHTAAENRAAAQLRSGADMAFFANNHPVKKRSALHRNAVKQNAVPQNGVSRNSAVFSDQRASAQKLGGCRKPRNFAARDSKACAIKGIRRTDIAPKTMSEHALQPLFGAQRRGKQVMPEIICRIFRNAPQQLGAQKINSGIHRVPGGAEGARLFRKSADLPVAAALHHAEGTDIFRMREQQRCCGSAFFMGAIRLCKIKGAYGISADHKHLPRGKRGMLPQRLPYPARRSEGRLLTCIIQLHSAHALPACRANLLRAITQA